MNNKSQAKKNHLKDHQKTMKLAYTMMPILRIFPKMMKMNRNQINPMRIQMLFACQHFYFPIFLVLNRFELGDDFHAASVFAQ